MKLLQLVTICIYAASSLQAQVDTSRGPIAPTPVVVVPTVNDLTGLFSAAATGATDPFEVVPAVAAWGDTIAPSLVAIARGAGSQSRALGIFAELALMAIESKTARQGLLETAQGHADPEIQGFALQALLQQIPNEDAISQDAPPIKLLQAFVDNLDDTLFLRCVQRTRGQVAREGVLKLTGLDMGEPQGRNTPAVYGKTKKATTVGYLRQLWWQAVRTKLQWDPRTAHFVVK